ncbi:hypothetical protein [Thalassotalea sp. PLHSN55]|uniref:hypothetical protein n=1 Tax=Thalassotalea sp. PLHSN55 TaxID=3435888 RepID=UPI003F8684C4
MIEKKLQQLFQQYIHAFQHFELGSVVGCYSFPCTLTTPDKIVLLKSSSDAEDEFTNIFSWMKQENANQIGVLSASYHEYSKSLAVVNIHWQFLNDKGQSLADFAALYHIDVSAEQAKIMHVVSHEISHSVDLANKLTIFEQTSQ